MGVTKATLRKYLVPSDINRIYAKAQTILMSGIDDGCGHTEMSPARVKITNCSVPFSSNQFRYPRN